jgi:hypothetical protein
MLEYADGYERREAPQPDLLSCSLPLLQKVVELRLLLGNSVGGAVLVGRTGEGRRLLNQLTDVKRLRRLTPRIASSENVTEIGGCRCRPDVGGGAG